MSHGPAAVRHTMPAGSLTSPGQTTDVPSQTSAKSHGPAEARQMVPAARTTQGFGGLQDSHSRLLGSGPSDVDPSALASPPSVGAGEPGGPWGPVGPWGPAGPAGPLHAAIEKASSGTEKAHRFMAPSPIGRSAAALEAPVLDAAFELAGREDALDVDEAAVVAHHPEELLLSELDILLVADGDDEAVEILVVLQLIQRHAVLVLGLRRVAAAVVDQRLDPELAQLGEDIGHLAVAQIVAVFLERQPQHADAGALHLEALTDQHLDQPLRHVRPDVVVDAAARENDLRLIAELLRLHRQVIRVDADAVAAHQAGPELEEVPLRAGRLQHVGGADVHALEDDRQLVHQRDVQIALRVLDDLGRLGDLDRRRAV